MKGKLLNYNTYYSLSSVNTVDDLGRKLKELYSYRYLLQDISDTKKISRMDIEVKLIHASYKQFKSINSFISDTNLKKYLKVITLDSKIKLLKYMLCGVYDERELEYDVEEVEDMLSSDSTGIVAKLVEARTIEEFIENLKGTEFYSVLSQVYTENVSLFELEMALDLYYYSRLWSMQNKYLDKKNKNIMHMINGTKVDIQNILWIYRLKLYYNVEPEKMYSYLIPINYKLTKEQIVKMVESRTMEELKNEIATTKYGKYFADDDNLDKIGTNILKDVYDRAVHLSPNSIAVIVSYIFYKELELHNVISLLEGVRYKLEPDKIMDYLVVK